MSRSRTKQFKRWKKPSLRDIPHIVVVWGEAEAEAYQMMGGDNLIIELLDGEHDAQDKNKQNRSQHEAR